VVLLHGCDGTASRAVEGWEQALGEWGYATLAVDSFGGRRVGSTCDSPSKLWFAERVPDAYAALAALAAEPKIARDRIALMGWGDGGQAAIRAASLVAAEHFSRPKAPRFRAFLALYPDCRVFLAPGPTADAVGPDMTKLAAPVRLHAGAVDERAPVIPCQALAQTLSARGNPVAITVYEGAAHAFDSEPAPEPKPVAGAVTPATGAGREERAPAAQAPAAAARTGPVSHWNPEATAAARRSVREELATLLGPA
jgi:dienelactone hydrolase